MSEPIVGDRNGVVEATIAVLCEGLRPEAHPAIRAVVMAHIGTDMTFIAVARRILDTYDIIVPATEFVEALRSFMDEHLNPLVYAYRSANDPQIEALSAITGFFIVKHSNMVQAVEQRLSTLM